jgi:hypothetical protein
MCFICQAQLLQYMVKSFVHLLMLTRLVTLKQKDRGAGLRGIRHGIMFKRMVQSSGIIETADGKFYMDKKFYEVRMQRIRMATPIYMRNCHWINNCSHSLSMVVKSTFTTHTYSMFR